MRGAGDTATNAASTSAAATSDAATSAAATSAAATSAAATSAAATSDVAEDAGAAWRSAFIEAPYLQSALVSLDVMADTFETACSWEAFPALDAAVRAAVTEAFREAGVKGSLSLRFTHVYPDGPAPYYTFICGLSRAQPKPRYADEIDQWSAVKHAACDALLGSGATITHHHAVGRVHRAHYEREIPALFRDVLRAARSTLDPEGLLNPGILTAHPLDDAP